MTADTRFRRALQGAVGTTPLLAAPALCRAHAPPDISISPGFPGGWNLEPWLLAGLAAAAVLYAVGARRLWRKAGAGRGISFGAAASFASGWVLVAVALVSPLDALAARAFSAHMLQHELLMVAAAPLLVASRPLEAWAWGLAPAWRVLAAHAAHRPALRATWRAITDPWGAWALHAVAIWAWHAPALFQWALAREGAHVLQHTSFFVTGLLFWGSVMGVGKAGRAGVAALLSLFTTMMHTGALGALLTFSPSLWYAHPAGGPEALGLDPLADQQLGGLIMWVPAGLAYLAAALAIATRWLAPASRPSQSD